MQGAGCLPYSSPNGAPALVTLLWRQNPEWRVEAQRQISLRMLYPSAYERVWVRSEDSEWRVEEGWLLFSHQVLFTFSLCIFAYMYVYVRVSNLGVTDSCGLPCGCWDLNPGPLKKKSVSPTIKPSLQLQGRSFKQGYYEKEIFTALAPRAKSSAWFWLSSGSWHGL